MKEAVLHGDGPRIPSIPGGFAGGRAEYYNPNGELGVEFRSQAWDDLVLSIG